MTKQSEYSISNEKEKDKSTRVNNSAASIGKKSGGASVDFSAGSAAAFNGFGGDVDISGPLCNTGPRVIIEHEIFDSDGSEKISIDWLTFVGTERTKNNVLKLVFEALNLKADDLDNATELKGQHGYRSGFQHPSGIYFLEGHEVNDVSWCLQLQGQACQSLSFSEVLLLVGNILLLHGVKVTRIDVALDMFGDCFGLIDRAEQSAKANYLRKVKTFHRYQSHEGKKLKGDTLYLGARGSRRGFVRLYDKGLETMTLEAGKWVRLEAVYKKDTANCLALELVKNNLQSSDIDRGKWVASQALTFVDFRIQTTKRKHLKTMVRCDWFQAIHDRFNAVPVEAVKAPVRVSDIDSYCSWFNKCVLPELEKVCIYLDAPDMTAGEVVDYVFGTGRKFKNLEPDSRTAELGKMIREKMEAGNAPF